jgi:hypothetical protein
MMIDMTPSFAEVPAEREKGEATDASALIGRQGLWQ